jgi:glycosyltransferase involved in cell wall biosynthesis
VISVVRNEAATLPRLLKSLSEFLSRGGEFIVVDTGSRDNTAQVARDGGARVFEEGDRFRYVVDEEKAKAINDKFAVGDEGPIINAGDSFFAFDKARNYAMGLSSCDFICTPDADEMWSVLNIDRINELIEQGYEKFMVDFVFSHNPDGTPSVAFCADTRFYDRRRIKWKGIIHETMQHQGELKMTRVTRDVAYLEHYQNTETDRTKYLAGLAWACYEEPENDRNSHYFARELMYRGRYKSAIKEFERHVAMGAWLDERGQSVVYIGCCHEALGDGEKALEYWHKAYSLVGTRREPLIHIAQYWRRHDSPVRCGAYAAAALQIPDNGFYGNRVANYTFEPHSLMYWAKGWQGDIPAARQHWLKCWEYHPDDPVFKRDFDYYFAKPKVSIVIPTVRPEKLEKCIKAIIENAGYANYEIITEKDDLDNPQGAPKVFKRGVEKSTGELVMYLGDDTIPQKNFLYHAVVAMHQKFPALDGMIGLNDMKSDGSVASHWLASKRLLPALGGEFFYTGYYHLFCDNELTGMARKLGKYHWCSVSKVFHDHTWEHDWSPETYDKFYKLAYEDHQIPDMLLCESRAKKLGFNIYPTKTSKFIDCRVINRIALPITRACNRDCPECSARKADPNWDKANPHITIDELKWAGRTLGPIEKIEVTGGEPSLHPDFEEISKNIHDWFECKDIMLLTNAVSFYNKPDKCELLLNYDRVYISWYTNEFAIKYKTDANTAEVNFLEGWLKQRGRNVWVQRMDAHVPIGHPPYTGTCMFGYDKGDSIGYGDKRLYGCCTSYWLPDKGKSIPLTEDWREHLGEIGLPCHACFLTGVQK